MQTNFARGAAIAAVFAVGLTACATTDPYTGQPVRNNTAIGAAAGALGGAALGYLTNTNKSEEGRQNALIGAGIGALAGAGVGQYMDRQQEQLRRQTQGTGIDVQRQGDNIVLAMPGDVLFAFNSDAVSPPFFGPLGAITQTINQYPATYVDVVGHADAVGADAYNQALSERRASSVASYLINQGVLRERLFVAGRGESQPRASNDNDAGRAQNRRVEIILRPHVQG
jgi:outer membrane protein OmpA-like peptidoglycan-associated protein